MEAKRKRMEELVAQLNKAARVYYQEADEIMSNQEYDKLYDELVEYVEDDKLQIQGQISCKFSVYTEQDLAEALENDNQIIRYIYGSDITITDLELLQAYSENRHKVSNDKIARAFSSKQTALTY